MRAKPGKPAVRTSNAKTSQTPKSARRPAGRKTSGKYDSIRADLLRQRVALLTQAGILSAEHQDQIISPDTTDQAQAEVDRNFSLRLKEREQKLLKKIDDAVSRIDNGIFGICRGCGQDIPLPRLRARPVTDLCIECKTRQEQEEILRGRR